MQTQLHLGDVVVDVVYKDIKNVHLSVHPPTGRVTVSAPRRMDAETLRAFVITQLGWVKRQQRTFEAQEREPAREFIERESHYVWGRRYLLSLTDHDGAPYVELTPNRLVLHLRADTPTERRGEILDAWYREQVKEAVPALLARWEPLIGVKVQKVHIQRMKTRWGTCTPATASLRLNTDLARKPRELLEYIIVHEMAHLREPTHNQRFASLMDTLLPHWRTYRQQLNQLPLRAEEWEEGGV